MRHSLWVFSLTAVLAAGATAVHAQYRNEEIVGKIERVDGSTVIVRRDGGAEVRITVSPSTEVNFSDSGDKRMFPNPTYRDLKVGMGVRFNFNEGNPARVTVHYVPDSAGSSSGSASASASGSSQVKARIESVSRDGRELRADVAGASRAYPVEGSSARGLRRGQLVLLTVENRGGTDWVTRVDTAATVGNVVRMNGNSVVISVDGRDETYSVDNRDLLDNVRNGQRVRFDVEERPDGRRVITAIRRY
jgi:hypothetical protein